MICEDGKYIKIYVYDLIFNRAQVLCYKILRAPFHLDITIKLRKKVITLYIAVDWKGPRSSTQPS
jgi:hypothetical protein